jgi:hypothetical protein
MTKIMYNINELQEKLRKQIDIYLQEANVLKMKHRVRPDARFRDQYFSLLGRVQAIQEIMGQLEAIEPVVLPERRKDERRRSS